MYDIYDIALLIPLTLVVMYWWRASGQRSVALIAARAYCKERNLQLLDESLVFTRYRIERDTRRMRRLCRIYEFDYCPDGLERETGEIILSGYSVLRVILHSDALEITDYGN
ncbi:MAG: hypothetical protein RLZZ227_1674 [Pseudomonadota bacterium]|jgi:hypothetical protein